MTKCAFITGASRGIGKGIALAMATAGYDIAFTYNSKLDEAQAVCTEITGMGRRCFYYQASMEKPDVPESVTAKAISDLGRIDLMVCNAGLTVHNSLLTTEIEKLDFVYNLDYRSYILCSKVAANFMVDNNIQGTILFITSTRGLRAYPEDCLYGSMKAALHRSCESMALELSKYQITVNCIAPGATAIRDNYTLEETRSNPIASKVPLGRVGTPTEIGQLALFLSSEHARYITGDIIKMDGGLIIPGIPENPNLGINGSWI